MTRRTHARLFTVEEANRAIKDLRKTLPELRRVLREIERVEERLQILDLICNRSVSSGNPDLQEFLGMRLKYHRRIARFEELLGGMEQQGHILTDLQEGIVHFVARKDGERVLLCWKEGEKEISHWHTLEEGAPDEERRLEIENWED